VLVPPGDADALAGALQEVLSGGVGVEALVARGRARSAGFSWTACAEGLASLYHEARAGGPGERGQS
jgi:glycosyltransferase involved in cell wall biosynthesis